MVGNSLLNPMTVPNRNQSTSSNMSTRPSFVKPDSMSVGTPYQTTSETARIASETPKSVVFADQNVTLPNTSEYLTYSLSDDESNLLRGDSLVHSVQSSVDGAENWSSDGSSLLSSRKYSSLGTDTNDGFTSLSSISTQESFLPSVDGLSSIEWDQFDRVKLRYGSGHPHANYSGLLSPLKATGGLVWLNKPTVNVTSNVAYDAYNFTHSIQDVQTFTSNSSPQITVTGMFYSQSVDEALYTLAAIHFMRSASKMSFGGESTDISSLAGDNYNVLENDDPFAIPVGTPPPVLYLSGYGAAMLNDLPVVITQFNLDLPQDVDYVRIPSGPGTGTKIPVAISINASLIVCRSPKSMRNFNINQYTHTGIKGWW